MLSIFIIICQKSNKTNQQFKVVTRNCKTHQRICVKNLKVYIKWKFKFICQSIVKTAIHHEVHKICKTEINTLFFFPRFFLLTETPDTFMYGTSELNKA